MPTQLTVEATGAALAVEVHEVGDHWSPSVDPESGKLPLLLLNPAVGDRRCWHRVVPTWSTTRRVVTFDQRGAGETTFDPSAEHDAVADALAVLDAVGIERTIVVGNSIGGARALHLALDHPGRVAGLLLVAPAITGAPRPDTADADAVPPQVLALDEACDAAEEAGDVDEAVRLNTHLWLDGWEAPGPRVDQPARDLFAQMVRTIVSSGDTGTFPEREPAWPRLEDVSVPTLVVTGGRDLPHMNLRAREAAQRIRRASVIDLPEAAHLPQLEAHLRFLNATAGFLALAP